MEVPKTGTLLAAGPRRDKIAEQLGKKYDGGMSMRALAAEYGRSYGFIHKLMGESGVKIRGRGGDTRRSADSS
ncbi:helix-turn-helix domain-containing protein [Streptomyces solisilvae]|uniref:helix-turn-helix domain-containing protein n=1 Tax=Streptomyces malaysiensis TaxID=92644 RepID=UPI0036A9E7D7